MRLASEMGVREVRESAPPMRIALLADMLEEQWPSMDLVAASLVRELRAQSDLDVQPVLVRPRLVRLTGAWRRSGPASTPDRVLNRFWLYRRALPGRGEADVFHVLDHSYGHLVRHLPEERSVLTCHDVDAFAALAEPRGRGGLPAFLVRRLLEGLARARLVVCPSRATASELIAGGFVRPDRVTVVHNGVDVEPMPCDRVTQLTAPLLGPSEYHDDLLHVGSTIARKRIDLLLEIFARVRRVNPRARLVRVGGTFTPAQERLADALGVRAHVLVLPPLDRETLSAVYQRAAMLLATSEREGFGLPVAEALAAGTIVLATDLPVFHEVAAGAARYLPLGHVERWAECVIEALAERRDQPEAWRRRQLIARHRGGTFSWSQYARDMAVLYRRVLDDGGAGAAAVPSAAERVAQR